MLLESESGKNEITLEKLSNIEKDRVITDKGVLLILDLSSTYLDKFLDIIKLKNEKLRELADIDKFFVINEKQSRFADNCVYVMNRKTLFNKQYCYQDYAIRQASFIIIAINIYNLDSFDFRFVRSNDSDRMFNVFVFVVKNFNDKIMTNRISDILNSKRTAQISKLNFQILEFVNSDFMKNKNLNWLLNSIDFELSKGTCFDYVDLSTQFDYLKVLLDFHQTIYTKKRLTNEDDYECHKKHVHSCLLNKYITKVETTIKTRISELYKKFLKKSSLFSLASFIDNVTCVMKDFNEQYRKLSFYSNTQKQINIFFGKLIHSFIRAKLEDMKLVFSQTILESIKVQLQNESSYAYSIEKEIQEKLTSFSKEFNAIPMEYRFKYSNDIEFWKDNQMKVYQKLFLDFLKHNLQKKFITDQISFLYLKINTNLNILENPLFEIVKLIIKGYENNFHEFFNELKKGIYITEEEFLKMKKNTLNLLLKKIKTKLSIYIEENLKTLIVTILKCNQEQNFLIDFMKNLNIMLIRDKLDAFDNSFEEYTLKIFKEKEFKQIREKAIQIYVSEKNKSKEKFNYKKPKTYRCILKNSKVSNLMGLIKKATRSCDITKPEYFCLIALLFAVIVEYLISKTI